MLWWLVLALLGVWVLGQLVADLGWAVHASLLAAGVVLLAQRFRRIGSGDRDPTRDPRRRT